jgi:hypothetical protein
MHGAELLRPVLSMLTYQWRVLSAKTGSSSAVSLDDAYMVENVKKQLVWAESEGARQGTKGGDGVASALLIIIRHAMLPAYHLYVVYIVQSNIYDDTDDLTTLSIFPTPHLPLWAEWFSSLGLTKPRRSWDFTKRPWPFNAWKTNLAYFAPVG